MKRTKKLLSLLLAIALVLTVAPLNWISVSAYDTPVLNSEGYYEISTADHLYWFAEQVNSGNNAINGVLMNNVVVNEEDDDPNDNAEVAWIVWTPIGNSQNTYQGTFDGAGYTITNMIGESNYDSPVVGVFGYNEGTIKNLNINKSTFEGEYETGAICGINGNYGTIENCHNFCDVTGTSESSYVAGIAGMSTGEIKNCSNSGKISNTSDNAGGICGVACGTIKNCFNTGSVEALNNAGGIVGKNDFDDDLNISCCYNTGDIEGAYYVAGICGSAGSSYLQSCYNTGTITGSLAEGCYIGALVGEANMYQADNFYSAYLIGCATDGTGTIQNGRGYGLEGETMDDYSTMSSIYALTEAEFISGEVAYFLNKHVTDGTQVWYQNIDNGEPIDVIPQYTGATVYENEVCIEDGLQYKYSNTFTPIQHGTFVDGICSICGETKPPVLVTTDNFETIGLAEEYIGYYCIYTANELYWFAEKVNSGNVKINALLMNDIVVNEGDLSQYDGASENTYRVWTPIGNYTENFSGTFDGAGYKISGLYFNDESATAVGLFGYNKGTVKNVGVENSFIYGYDAVGGVCGFNDKGTITNCYNTSLVVGTFYNGGICGSNSGMITDCYNEGTVNTLYYYLGGICGFNNGGEIKGCYNTGLIYGGSLKGGICGYNASGTISESYNTGIIYSVGGSYVGGVCGLNNDIVSKSYNTGNVIGKTSYGDGGSYVGGVCGYNNEVIENCYNTGDVAGKECVGGVCGCNSYGSLLESCYNIGNISGELEVGSIAGVITIYEDEESTISNCYYLEDSAVDNNGVIQNGSGSDINGSPKEDIAGVTTVKTAEQFASGEVAYLLNKGLTDGTQVWYQNIDNGETIDTSPKFVGGTVYNCISLCSGAEQHYTNDIDCPDKFHNFVDGVCNECGVSFINPWKSQIRFDKNEDGTFAGTFDYRVLATITRDDLMAVFSSEENAEKTIVEAGFVFATDTDVSNFDYETAKNVVKGTSTAYTKAPVTFITTYFDTDNSVSGAGDYVMSCIVEDVPEKSKNMCLATVAYIVYNDDNGNLCYMFYPAINSVCFEDLYNTYYPQAFPS